MTLADKRKVIEVLLCAASPWNPGITGSSTSLNYGEPVTSMAWGLWQNIDEYEHVPGEGPYEIDCTEAAYRLIESSPTLRREWFGAP